MTTSRMSRHTAFEPTHPNVCVCGGVADVINCGAQFFENWLRGSGAGMPEKMAFHITLTTMSQYHCQCQLHCD